MTARKVGAALAVVLFLSACAAEPTADWDPPGWNDPVPANSAEGAGSPEGTEAAEGTESGEQAESGEAAEVDPVSMTHEAASSLLGQRIWNEGISLQARWAYLPGDHPFNARMDEFVREVIDSAGDGYSPQVVDPAAIGDPAAEDGAGGDDDAQDRAGDTGLSERGCVAGTLERPADEILTDPALGPPGGSGTSLTCEVAGAFGPIIGISLRVVAGEVEGESVEIRRDDRTTIYANVETGELVESKRLWNDEAPVELWSQAIEGLRRDAGGLSRLPVAAPDEEQLALATTALESVQLQDGGSAVVTLPAGLTSPELVGLGVPVTEEAIQVEIAAETVQRWRSLDDALSQEFGEALSGASETPFVGLPEWTGDAHVNCSLVPCVALTFDDGPSEYTEELLSTLREARAPATFYMLGRNMNLHPDLVAAVAADGHEIGSHTMNHPDLTKLSKKKMRSEVNDAAELIEAATGETVTSYRPPYGAIDATVRKEVKLPAVLWSVDTNDWQKPGIDLLVERAVDGAAPGDIVLFHDIHEASVDAQGGVLDGLAARGFVPVTVSQLFDGNIPAGQVTKR